MRARLASAGVVAGEHGEPAEPAQQDVLGGPASDAAKRDESLDHRVVTEVGEPFEIEPCVDCARELEQRANLVMVEAKRAQLRRVQRGDLLRTWKCVRAARRSTARLPTTIVRAYVRPSHLSISLFARLRSVHAVRSSRNGAIGCNMNDSSLARTGIAWVSPVKR